MNVCIFQLTYIFSLYSKNIKEYLISEYQNKKNKNIYFDFSGWIENPKVAVNITNFIY